MRQLIYWFITILCFALTAHSACAIDVSFSGSSDANSVGLKNTYVSDNGIALEEHAEIVYKTSHGVAMTDTRHVSGAGDSYLGQKLWGQNPKSKYHAGRILETIGATKLTDRSTSFITPYSSKISTCTDSTGDKVATVLYGYQQGYCAESSAGVEGGSLATKQNLKLGISCVEVSQQVEGYGQCGYAISTAKNPCGYEAATGGFVRKGMISADQKAVTNVYLSQATQDIFVAGENGAAGSIAISRGLVSVSGAAVEKGMITSDQGARAINGRAEAGQNTKIISCGASVAGSVALVRDEATAGTIAIMGPGVSNTVQGAKADEDSAMAEQNTHIIGGTGIAVTWVNDQDPSTPPNAKAIASLIIEV